MKQKWEVKSNLNEQIGISNIFAGNRKEIENSQLQMFKDMSTLFIPYLSSGFVFMVERGHNVKKSRQTGKTHVNNIYRRAE